MGGGTLGASVDACIEGKRCCVGSRANASPIRWCRGSGWEYKRGVLLWAPPKPWSLLSLSYYALPQSDHSLTLALVRVRPWSKDCSCPNLSTDKSKRNETHIRQFHKRQRVLQIINGISRAAYCYYSRHPLSKISKNIMVNYIFLTSLS